MRPPRSSAAAPARGSLGTRCGCQHLSAAPLRQSSAGCRLRRPPVGCLVAGVPQSQSSPQGAALQKRGCKLGLHRHCRRPPVAAHPDTFVAVASAESGQSGLFARRPLGFVPQQCALALVDRSIPSSNQSCRPRWTHCKPRRCCAGHRANHHRSPEYKQCRRCIERPQQPLPGQEYGLVVQCVLRSRKRRTGGRDRMVVRVGARAPAELTPDDRQVRMLDQTMLPRNGVVEQLWSTT